MSDTRREDVARALRINQSSDPLEQTRLARWWDDGLASDDVEALVYRQADVVLAALPAPPVVDEAEIAKVLAEFDSVPWANMRRETKDIYRSMAAAVAARLRGADRG